MSQNETYTPKKIKNKPVERKFFKLLLLYDTEAVFF